MSESPPEAPRLSSHRTGTIIVSIVVALLLIIVVTHAVAGRTDVRSKLVAQACGWDTSDIPSSSQWTLDTASNADYPQIDVTLDGGRNAVLFFAEGTTVDQVHNNARIDEVSCYRSTDWNALGYGGGLVTWSPDGKTYTLDPGTESPTAISTPDVVMPPTPTPTVVWPVTPTATVIPTATPNEKSPGEVDCSSLNEIQCDEADLVVKRCATSPLTIAVDRDVAPGLTMYTYGLDQLNAYVSGDVHTGVSVESCSKPSNGIDVVAMQKAIASGSGFAASRIDAISCQPKAQALDELPVGETFDCNLYVGGSRNRSIVTVIRPAPHYLIGYAFD